MSVPSSNSLVNHDRQVLRIVMNGGDNMLGRAVQLSFPVQAPGEEEIKDSCTAQRYLDMCLHHPSCGGPRSDLTLPEIRKLNAKGEYLWGDVLGLEMHPPPDIRLLNLETAVTKSIYNEDVPLGKGIRYHFHVDNVEGALGALARTRYGGDRSSPLVIGFSNNHCMDYGRQAFEQETLPTVQKHSSLFHTVGVGMDFQEAATPVRVPIYHNDMSKKGLIEVFAFSCPCSGTPRGWYATSTRSGLVGLPDLRYDAADSFLLAKQVIGEPTNETFRIVSIHWGPNWAHKGETEEDLAARRTFAHRLIDECGVDLVYGHSSHHIRGLERYHEKLIVYGAGDLVNDYEGFENLGEEDYNRLGGIFVADYDTVNKTFQQLRIVPFFMDRLRLVRYKSSLKIWSPMKGRMELPKEPLDRFINRMSQLDVGSGSAALHLEAVDDDPSTPGGQTLRTAKY